MGMKEFLGIDKNEWEYIRYIVFQNFVVSTFILLFMWEGWDWRIHEYITLGSMIEILLLLVSIPVYLSFAMKLFKTMKSNKIKITSFLFCTLMSVLLISGIGMRFTANQIRMSVDTPIVEFFDEYLSHYMIWTGIIGLNAFFAFFQDNVLLKKRLGNSEMIVVIVSGLLQGMIVTLGVLESRVGLYTLIVGSLFLNSITCRSSGERV